MALLGNLKNDSIRGRELPTAEENPRFAALMRWYGARLDPMYSGSTRFFSRSTGMPIGPPGVGIAEAAYQGDPKRFFPNMDKEDRERRAMSAHALFKPYY